MVGPSGPIYGENGDGCQYIAAESMRCPECHNEEFNNLRQQTEKGVVFLSRCTVCKTVITVIEGVKL